MRLVDADLLKEEIKSLGGMFLPNMVTVDLDSIMRAIDEAPTIEAEPVAHGYNVYGHNSMFECSVCGFTDWDTALADGKFNCCPNCFAKMDGECDE